MNSNYWNYSAIVSCINDAAEEYGIKVKPVNEANTYKMCSLCGETNENERIIRGLFECPQTGKVINADLNEAINMMKNIPKSYDDRGKWLKVQACGLVGMCNH